MILKYYRIKDHLQTIQRNYLETIDLKNCEHFLSQGFVSENIPCNRLFGKIKLVPFLKYLKKEPENLKGVPFYFIPEGH